MIKKFNVEKTKKLDKLNKVLSKIYRKPSREKEVKLSEIENVLIIDFALMGDMVMNIPFLKTIRRNCPKSNITMVAMPWAKVILGDQNLVDEFITFDGKNKLSSPKMILKNALEIRKVLREINQKTYQIAIEPKGDLRHIWFMRMTRSQRTVSYNYTGGDYLITDCFVPKANTQHLIDEKLDLLEFIDMKIGDVDRTPSLVLSKESNKIIEDFINENNIKNKRIIGLHPGASNINKQFRYYPQLISRLAEVLLDRDFFCVFEGPGEDEIVDEVCKSLGENKISFVRVKRPTKEYVALVSVCDIMICNDSAAGHIAASYGIPSVVIFGPVKPETALPKGKTTVKYISHDLGCKPCTLPICPYGTNECINGISVNEVYDMVIKILALE